MENKYIYEALDVKDKKGSFAACEGLWQPATEDSVKAIVERVKACCETDEAVREKNPGYVGIARSAKDYEWENVKKRRGWPCSLHPQSYARCSQVSRVRVQHPGRRLSCPDHRREHLL